MTQLIDNFRLDQRESAGTRAVGTAVSHLADVMLRRAVHLPKDDRLLIELLLRSHLSQRKIATMLELPHGTVSRRLKRIGGQLRDPLIVRLLDGPCPLDRVDRQIAIGYFVQRQPLKELAKEYQQSSPQISRRLQFVRGWFRGVTARKTGE